jgi:hypothetical protein
MYLRLQLEAQLSQPYVCLTKCSMVLLLISTGCSFGLGLDVLLCNHSFICVYHLPLNTILMPGESWHLCGKQIASKCLGHNGATVRLY